MGDRTAFFYGTLMAREILYRVCFDSSNVSHDPVKAAAAARLTIRPAMLHGYCRHKVLHADYPGIIPEEDKTVRGTYVTGLTDGHIWRLDRFEGSSYERRKVRVVLLKPAGGSGGGVEGEEVGAETYIWMDGDEYLEKVEWDYEVFRKEKMHRWADRSEEFQEVDDAVAADGHDPTGGRGVNSDILRKLQEEEE